jgi:hypothetical protein
MASDKSAMWILPLRKNPISKKPLAIECVYLPRPNYLRRHKFHLTSLCSPNNISGPAIAPNS